jgi:hypothetical protein
MKKLVLALVVSVMSLSVFGQSKKTIQQYHIDSVYVDKSNNLLKQSIVEYPGMSSEQIKEGVSQWVGLNFRSAEGVIKSNTQYSLTMTPLLSYSVKVLGMPYSYDVKLQVHFEFKDEKMRITYTELPADYYSTTTKTMTTRTMKDNFLKLDGTHRDVIQNKGMYKSYYKNLDGAITRVNEFIKKVDNIQITSLTSTDW